MKPIVRQRPNITENLQDLSDRLDQLLDKFVLKNEQRNTYAARLGNGSGVLFIVDENGNQRQGYVWGRVMLPGGMTTMQLRCLKSMPMINSEVYVRLGIDEVMEVIGGNPNASIPFMGEYGSADVGKHASNHSRMGADPLKLQSLQYMPLLTRPNDTPNLNVYVEPYLYPFGIGQAFDGALLDLTSYVPSGTDEQRFVIVGLDVTTNALTVYPGAVATFTYSSGNLRTVPFSRADVAEILVQEDFIPSAAVRLYAGMTRIELFDIFEDCRNWFEVPNRKHNYNATIAPTVDDDVTLGYRRGSFWFVNGTVAFTCYDATPGDADWRAFGTATGGGGNVFESLFVQGTDYQYSLQSGGVVFSRYTNVDIAGVQVNIDRGRGTLDTPLDVQTGDYIEELFFRGYADGGLRNGGILRSEIIDPAPNGTSMATKFTWLVSDIGSVDPAPVFNWTSDLFAFDVPLDVASLTTTERDALTPDNGWLIYNTTTNTFQFRQNGAWVDLGTGSGGIAVEENNVSVVATATTLNLVDFNVEDAGSNQANVYHNLPSVCTGRLTLTSGVGVTTADVTGAGTIYFTSHQAVSGGDNDFQISLYDGTRWKLYLNAQISLALTLTSGSVYDIFIYDNAGTLTLESLVWSSATARATALDTLDGVLIKSGANTRRYLGTIKASGTNTTEDSEANRYVWNYYNQEERSLKKADATASWNSSSTAWQSANSSTANRVNFVIGVERKKVYLMAGILALLDNGDAGAVGIGLDSTSANSAHLTEEGSNSNTSTLNSPIMAVYHGFTGIGSHFLQWLERVRFGTVTYVSAGTVQKSGLVGWVWG